MGHRGDVHFREKVIHEEEAVVGAQELLNGATGHPLPAQSGEPIAHGPQLCQLREAPGEVRDAQQILCPYEIALFIVLREPPQRPGGKAEGTASLHMARHSIGEPRERTPVGRHDALQCRDGPARPIASVAREDLVSPVTVQDDLAVGARGLG